MAIQSTQHVEDQLAKAATRARITRERIAAESAARAQPEPAAERPAGGTPLTPGLASPQPKR